MSSYALLDDRRTLPSARLGSGLRSAHGDDYDATSEKRDRGSSLDSLSVDEYTLRWRDKIVSTVWLHPGEYVEYLQEHHPTQVKNINALAKERVGEQAYVIINKPTGRVVHAQRLLPELRNSNREKAIVVYVNLSQEEEDWELASSMPSSAA